MPRLLPLLVALIVLALPARALDPRDGWAVVPTDKDFATLLADTRAAVDAAPIAIVTQASASDGATMQGIEIPGNRVFGLFRNDYARRLLAASVAAGIEAPIRLYLTEEADGTATLSYKLPSAILAPYAEEGGAALSDSTSNVKSPTTPNGTRWVCDHRRSAADHARASNSGGSASRGLSGSRWPRNSRRQQEKEIVETS